MAKAKEAKAAPKKAKTEDKTAKKRAKAALSTTKAAGLSEERVVDSDDDDDDDDEERPAVKAVVVQAPKPVKEKKEKKTKAAAPIPPPPTKQPSPSSSDDDEDSDEASDKDAEMTDAPVLAKPAAASGKVNGTKRKAESVSSSGSGESSEDGSSEEDTKPDPKRAKTALKDAGEVAQVGQVGTDSDDDSDSDSEESNAPKEPLAATVPAPKRPQHSGNLGSIPVQSFKPPSGYSGVAVTNTTFSSNSFAGRQIWHIVAPRSVPLKSVQDVSLAAIQSGAAVLSHKDTEFSLIEEENPSTQFDSIVIPSSNGYEGVSQPITKTLHIRQKVSLPKLSKKQADTNTGSSAAADISQPSVSEARPQPKGMRMRYKPAGFGAGDPGLGSDSEEDSAQVKTNGTKAQFPKALGGHGAATSADRTDNAKAKRSKKKRKDSDFEMANGDAVVSAPVSHAKIAPKAAEDSRASIADASVAKDELSKEEKQRRKAEKKERRASKVAVAA